jgi:hypothetical protein
MNFQQITIKKAQQVFFLLAILGGFFLTSCEKSVLDEPLEEARAEQPLDFRASVLHMIYGLSGEQLDAPWADELFAAATSGLSAEQYEQLEGLVEQYYTAETAASQVGGTIGFRSLQESSLSSGMQGDEYGNSVAKAGNSLFVGAPGSSRVYRYVQGSNGSYTLAQILPGRSGMGRFVAAEGNWMGAYTPESTQVTMFKNMGTYWTMSGIINTGLSAVSGTDLEMSGDQMAVMGSPSASPLERHIKVYTRNGNNWAEQATIALEDVFFWDMDIDGNTIVANGGTNAGSGVFINPQIYIFNKVGNAWVLSATLPQPGSLLARAVAIEGGVILANTAFYASQPSNRTAVLTNNGGGWALSGELLQPLPLPFVQTRWLDIQGSKAVVTLPTGYFSPEAGDAAHVFEQSGSSWSLINTVEPSTGGFDFLFGQSVVLDGGQVIIGASPSSIGGAGKAFIYQ